MSASANNRKRSNDDDTNDGRSRRSFRLSDADNDTFTTPAIVSRSNRITRNTFKFCPDINGLSKAHCCDGCQRFEGSTRKINKPRTEITTKTLQCTEIWKLDASEVPPSKLHHYERVMEAIRKYERIEPTALIENLRPTTATNNVDNENNDEENKNINNIATPTPSPTIREVNFWKQDISVQGKTVWIDLPSTHKVVLKSDLSRWEKDLLILRNVRKKMQSVSYSTNICGQTTWAIALASVPALGMSAAQCFVALVFYAMMIDTGLFNFRSKRKPFNMHTFAQSFPSEGHLRKLMNNQAARDTMSLGKQIRTKRVYLACDKGNKKGVSHFIKYLAWFDFEQMQVKKQLLDMDASDGTSEDCAYAIKHSLLKLGDIQLSGQATDSGGGGVLEGLAKELEKLNLCGDDYIVAACSIHGLQLQLANAVKRTLGEGGLGQRNAMQMLHSVYDLQESVSISIKLCPPVSNRDIDQSVLLLNGEYPQLECSIPKDVVWSLATGQ